MKQDTVCAKCGSSEVETGVSLSDRGHYDVPQRLSIIVDEKPEALLFHKQLTFKIQARICGRCGYIELYAADPKALMASYRRRLANKKAKKK